MRKTLRACALVLMLCSPAFAGDVGSPPVNSTTQTTAGQGQSADECINTGVPEPAAESSIHGDDDAINLTTIIGVFASVLQLF